MADDDKGAKPETTRPVEHSAATNADERGLDEPTQTEWTASDRRGPLGSAEDEDVERFVPAHETDAEGGVDPHASAVAPVVHGAAENGSAEHVPVEHESAPRDHVEPVEAAAVAEPRTELPSGGSPRPADVAEPGPKRSLVPVAAGLVIGALIGAGSAWLVYSQAGSGGDSQVATLASRIDVLEKRPDPQGEIAALKAGLGDVQDKVTVLTKQPPVAPKGQSGSSAGGAVVDAGLAGKVAALQGDVDRLKTQSVSPTQSQASGPSPLVSAPPSSAPDAGLAGRVAALQTALDEVKSRTAALQVQDAKEASAVDKVSALQGSVADAQKQAAGAQSGIDTVQNQQKQLGDKLAELTVAVAGALKVANGAQSGVQTVQGQQKMLEGKLGSPALAVVSDSLVQQIDAGLPYSRQVEALAALSADPAKIAVLRENAAHGVPSAQALLGQWKPLEDPIIATGNKAPAHANFGERLEHGLFGLVSVRRADGTTGNDLASRVGLIEADLAHDDVPGAYAAWQALPTEAKARSDSWGALVKTSVEALSAARDLQHAAIDALGAKKS